MKKINEVLNVISQTTKNIEGSVKETSKNLLNKYSSNNLAKGQFESTSYYQVNSLKKIDLDIYQGNVKIKQSTFNKVKITMKVNLYYDKNEFNKPQDYFYRSSILDIKNDILEINIPNRKIIVDLIIELPNITYQTISTTLRQGNLQLFDLKTTDLFIKNKTGNITLNNLRSNLVQITNNVGHINVDNSIINQLDLSLTTGDINLTGDFLNLKANTVNGNLKIDKKNIKTNQINLQVINGDIDLKVCNEVDFKLNAKLQNGQIYLEEQGLIIERVDNLHERQIKAYTKQQVDQYIELNTKNGNIKLTR